jgi:hypothetical protein
MGKAMTDNVEKLGRDLLETVAHVDSGTAVVLVALAALGVAALSLWTLAVVVKALAARRR